MEDGVSNITIRDVADHVNGDVAFAGLHYL